MSQISKALKITNEYFADVIKENFEEVAEVEFSDTGGKITGESESFKLFHATDVHMLEADDSLLFGIRANHFVVEEGYCENHYIEDTVLDDIPTTKEAFLVSANHKGVRIQKLFIEKIE